MANVRVSVAEKIKFTHQNRKVSTALPLMDLAEDN
jgi:hypothetical protein